MTFHVLTLFPEMVETVMNTSIIGRALKAGHIAVDIIDIRTFSDRGNGRVDDYPYGGGAGMVMQPGPIDRACQKAMETAAPGTRVIYTSPQGRVFDQQMARELAREEDLIILCGHYEGVDERIIEKIVTDEVSIGDYVLTGGELPALVMIDAIARMTPGVLKNQESGVEESFSDGLLEYPQYTRPPEYDGRKVPEILLSGDHEKVRAWRREKSLERTLKKRPDLLKNR